MTESPITKATLVSLLGTLSEGEVLVGGQALWFWAHYFGVIDDDAPLFSKDADILGDRMTVERLSKVFRHGRREPLIGGFGTVLLGEVYLPVDNQETAARVDVINSICGADTQKVKDSALKVTLELEGKVVEFAVLHPIDCLKSKTTNLAVLKDKQDAYGIMQAHTSLSVGRAFIKRLVEEAEWDLVHTFVEVIAKHARSATGQACRNFEVEIYDALPMEALERSPGEKFISQRLPRLKREMARKK